MSILTTSTCTVKPLIFVCFLFSKIHKYIYKSAKLNDSKIKCHYQDLHHASKYLHYYESYGQLKIPYICPNRCTLRECRP